MVPLNSDHQTKYVKRPGDFKISISELKVGMFVSGLDRDWLGTPFLLQGFYIKSVEDVQLVSQYCKYVYVFGESLFKIKETVDLDSVELIGRTPQKYPLKSTIQEELESVRVFIKVAREVASKLMSDARVGYAFNSNAVRAVVTHAVESVLRHPDALMWMTKLRGEDEYTVEHSINVCFLAIIYGRRLGLRKNQLQNLGLCGLLHDVGKMRVPKEVLNKPGALTDDEMKIMQRHSGFGKSYLAQRKDTYQGAIDAAFGHHERYDGKGYPRGIDASELTIFTRIITIVDAYDAITGDRVYAKGRPSVEALRIIYEERGKQFDDKLALGFIQTIGIYPPGSVVELVNGCVGIVADVASGLKHLPRILVVLDQDKQPWPERYVDLSQSVDRPANRDYLIKMTLADGCYGVFMRSYLERGVLVSAPELELEYD